MEISRVEWHLLNWVDWMQRGQVTRGYPSRAAGFVAGGYSSDFDAMCDAVDNRCAAATNAIINDLPNRERLAVLHEYSISVFRIRRDQEGALLSAKEKIGKMLDKRGIF